MSSAKTPYIRMVATVWSKALSPLRRLNYWRRSLQPRTPHRSFRPTRRRDYIRSLELPGYVAFTAEVWNMIWRYKAPLGGLTVVYAFFTILLVGLASQETYSQLAEVVRVTGDGSLSGGVGRVGEAVVLLVTSLSGGLNPAISESQQLLASFLVLMMWLTTVWLLRAFLAGQRPKLRDAIYNAGAPIIPTIMLSLVLVAQLIPAAIVTIGISAAMPSGLVNEGIESMLFWTVAMLLSVLSLYWITSTLLALIVVTLPGMYPLQALKTANELALGRRFRILLRILWLAAVTTAAFLLVLIPIIMLDSWLRDVLPQLAGLPLVPISLLIASSFSVVWSASYIYLLYRKIVEDDSEPA